MHAGCAPSSVPPLVASVVTGGNKSTRRFVLAIDGHGRQMKLRVMMPGSRRKVVTARAAMAGGWRQQQRAEEEDSGGKTGRRGPAGGLVVWALVASNLASLALLVHRYYTYRHSGGGDSGGAARQQQQQPAVAVAEPAVEPDAVINLELGDPTMYEAFWREAGERAAVVIPAWRGMSYFADAGGLCWFLEPELEREVRRVHRLVGNAAVDDGYHLVVGTGATQLFQAAMYALSPADGADLPVGVVSPAPYYSSYPPQTDLLVSGLYRWAGDANAFDGGAHIELVCSPNNPDGAIREAVLSSESGKAIHDLVYYWPQYTPIAGRAAHDVMLFTVSKITGHAGTRLGWALVKDRDVAKKMVYFVDRSTIGVSKDSQLRAAKLLGVVSDAYDDEPPPSPLPPPPNDDVITTTTRPRLFDFARRRMAERWRALRAAVAASGAFSLPEETTGQCNFAKQPVAAYPAFAWLRCEKEGVDDCAEFLRGHKIVTLGGQQFGADRRCVRINMLDRDRVFEILIHRLSSIAR